MFSFAVGRGLEGGGGGGRRCWDSPWETRHHSTHLENKFDQKVAADGTLLFLASGCCGGVAWWLREQDTHVGGSWGKKDKKLACILVQVPVGGVRELLKLPLFSGPRKNSSLLLRGRGLFTEVLQDPNIKVQFQSFTFHPGVQCSSSSLIKTNKPKSSVDLQDKKKKMNFWPPRFALFC